MMSCSATNIADVVVPSVATHGIIPLPKNIDLPEGSVSLNQDFVFVTNSDFNIANQTAYNILSASLTTFQTSTNASGKINFELIQDKNLKSEAYSILINSDGILIKAGDDAGAFYAVQSLKQYLLSITGGTKQSNINLHFLSINDEPKYYWRAFQLDVSRHMFRKEYLMKIIDWLSYYKYNKFHIHFTDDQGWRIESKTFPLLNSIGSWRYLDHNDSIWSSGSSDVAYSIDSQFLKNLNGQTMYGGYYSQADIAEIVTYAKNHYIEIIPEIDTPGHMTAAIKAYPTLSCNSTFSANEVAYSIPICPCNQDVYNFVYQVWDDILPLFSSKYVHIGADEVSKSSWGKSTDCELFIKKNNLSDTTSLQSFFVSKIQNYLEEKGKTIVAWDDITVDTNHGNTLSFDQKLKIMYWRNWMQDVPSIIAANGNDIIYSNWDIFYLSSENTQTNLIKLLEYDIETIYPQSVNNKILGFEGCVWTEKIPSEKVLESLIFPRIQALSEVNWSAYKNLFSFNTRLEPHKKYMKSLGINWTDPK